MASQPSRRVRTGCLKCRVRRRKCDEGKPRCQRCIAGGFECKYGTRLSFLEKNAITAPSQAKATAAAASSNYRRVQFVPEVVARQSASPRPAERDTTSPQDDFPMIYESPRVEPTPPQPPLTPQPSTTSTTENDIFTSNSPPEQAARISLSIQHPQPNCTWEGGLAAVEGGLAAVEGGLAAVEGYEIALDALLSLGADKGDTPTGDERALRSPPRPRRQQLRTTHHLEPYGSTARNTETYSHGSPETNTRALATQKTLGFSETRTLGLLRYYRYEVAPWLDICDLGQAFGITIPCIASMSRVVLSSMLRFTASLTGQAGSAEDQRGGDCFLAANSRPYTLQPPEGDSSTKLLCRVFSESKRILRSELGTSSLHGIDELVELIRPSAQPLRGHPIHMAAYYLMLRLDLGNSLVSCQPPLLPIWTPQDFPFDGQRSELAARVFRSTSEILVLCARAASLVFGAHDSRLGESRVEQWSALFERLESWCTNRCQEFRPMVEVDGKGDDFPTLLFTNGAGLMATQLYHTAMLLMLQNRPRTFKALGPRVSPAMSSLSHARRICGIALANDSRDCWDPSLVASFVVASRGMTHSTQHQLLLGRLDGIGKLTGWKVGHYRDVLMEEWGV